MMVGELLNYEPVTHGKDDIHIRTVSLTGKDVGNSLQILETAVKARLIPDDKVLIAGKEARSVLHRLARDMDCNFDGTIRTTTSLEAKSSGSSCWELTFPGGSFDIVMCTDNLRTLADPFCAFSELLRVTKPGGSVCFPVSETKRTDFLCGSHSHGVPHMTTPLLLTSTECSALVQRGA